MTTLALHALPSPISRRGGIHLGPPAWKLPSFDDFWQEFVTGVKTSNDTCENDGALAGTVAFIRAEFDLIESGLGFPNRR
jgi:hypothetical protein